MYEIDSGSVRESNSGTRIGNGFVEGIASEVGLEVWVARQWLGRAGQAGPARPEGVNKRVLKLGTKD